MFACMVSCMVHIHTQQYVKPRTCRNLFYGKITTIKIALKKIKNCFIETERICEKLCGKFADKKINL